MRVNQDRTSKFHNILVTGGAGFIGSHLCGALLGQGRSVCCLDELNDYYDPGLKLANLQELEQWPDFDFRKGDIRDLSLLEDLFREKEFDAVVHLAARAGVRPSVEDPFLYQDVNVRGTLNILECCRKFLVDKHVFASSSSVYGCNRKVPFSESDQLDALASPYASTKVAGEALCQSYYHLYGINMACLRFFTVYGPRQRPDMAINKFASGIMGERTIEVFGDGSSKRDYTYIDDIVDGVIRSLDAGLGFEVYNLGESNTVELSCLISLLEKEIGKEAKIVKKPMHPGDVPLTYADISKAEEQLGYKPSVNIEEGIKKYVAWLRSWVESVNNETGTLLKPV